jgi:hypothetical protein
MPKSHIDIWPLSREEARQRLQTFDDLPPASAPIEHAWRLVQSAFLEADCHPLNLSDTRECALLTSLVKRVAIVMSRHHHPLDPACLDEEHG